MQWLKGYLQAYDDKKREQSRLDFTDFLLVTRDLGSRLTLTSGAIFNAGSIVLVDELQDTDPLQAEIVFFLAEQEPRASEWIDVALRPGKLFLVGDPQQSIYRFRRRGPGSVLASPCHYRPAREVLILADNFVRAPRCLAG